MNLSSVQAAVAAIVSQVVTLVVGFGLVDNTTAGIISAASVAIVNAAFLIAHSVHANAAAKVQAATVTAPAPPGVK